MGDIDWSIVRYGIELLEGRRPKPDKIPGT
jgi:hypothetical protein